MKLSKIILLCIITLSFTTHSNASRTKKDLIPNQEDKIIILLKEKIAIVDKLINEAKIYKDETDPLIEKDFFNLPSGFVTKAKRHSKYIQTHTDTSSLIKKPKPTGYLNISSNKIGIPRSEFHSPNKDREIFNIKMRKYSQIKTSYSNNVNYIYILGNMMNKDIRRVPQISKKKFAKMIEKNLEKVIQPLTTELLNKYAEFITLLSKNKVNKELDKLVQTDKAQNWSIYTKIFVFKFSPDIPSFNKKKNYELSLMLSETFKNLHSKAEVTLTSIPSYYEHKRMDDSFQCLESAKAIKYKGRICINPIDVDKDNYFKFGVFETRENNFLQANSQYFDSLVALDKKLKKVSKEYIQYLILELTSAPKTTKINIEGGL